MANAVNASLGMLIQNAMHGNVPCISTYGYRLWIARANCTVPEVSLIAR